MTEKEIKERILQLVPVKKTANPGTTETFRRICKQTKRKMQSKIEQRILFEEQVHEEIQQELNASYLGYLLLIPMPKNRLVRKHFMTWVRKFSEEQQIELKCKKNFWFILPTHIYYVFQRLGVYHMLREKDLFFITDRHRDYDGWAFIAPNKVHKEVMREKWKELKEGSKR